MVLKTPPLYSIEWRKSWRIIPSRFPPINLFERVSSSSDWETLASIESLTNDRLRDENGQIFLISPEDRVSGPGSSFIMAPFTHVNPSGSRFSNGQWGVYYAAHDIKTAIAETKFHREIFMKATKEPPMHLDMRVLLAKIKGDFHDIRGQNFINSPLYDEISYKSSQDLAKHLKNIDSNGIVYKSVRYSMGQNIAVFKPKLISNCIQERHLEYIWDGKSISSILEKKLLT